MKGEDGIREEKSVMNWAVHMKIVFMYICYTSRDAFQIHTQCNIQIDHLVEEQNLSKYVNDMEGGKAYCSIFRFDI